MEPAQITSVEPLHRHELPEMDWDEVHEPGAYVEKGSGDLYRIPKEALINGGSLLISKESRGASRLVQLSRDPFVTTVQARLSCCQHNITPNF